MANKYWVSTGDTSSLNAANWATTSGGSGGAGFSNGDNPIFDSGSSVDCNWATIQYIGRLNILSSYGGIFRFDNTSNPLARIYDGMTIEVPQSQIGDRVDPNLSLRILALYSGTYGSTTVYPPYDTNGVSLDCDGFNVELNSYTRYIYFLSDFSLHSTYTGTYSQPHFYKFTGSIRLAQDVTIRCATAHMSIQSSYSGYRTYLWSNTEGNLLHVICDGNRSPLNSYANACFSGQYLYLTGSKTETRLTVENQGTSYKGIYPLGTIGWSQAHLKTYVRFRRYSAENYDQVYIYNGCKLYQATDTIYLANNTNRVGYNDKLIDLTNKTDNEELSDATSASQYNQFSSNISYTTAVCKFNPNNSDKNSKFAIYYWAGEIQDAVNAKNLGVMQPNSAMSFTTVSGTGDQYRIGYLYNGTVNSDKNLYVRNIYGGTVYLTSGKELRFNTDTTCVHSPSLVWYSSTHQTYVNTIRSEIPIRFRDPLQNETLTIKYGTTSTAINYTSDSIDNSASRYFLSIDEMCSNEYPSAQLRVYGSVYAVQGPINISSQGDYPSMDFSDVQIGSFYGYWFTANNLLNTDLNLGLDYLAGSYSRLYLLLNFDARQVFNTINFGMPSLTTATVNWLTQDYNWGSTDDDAFGGRNVNFINAGNFYNYWSYYWSSRTFAIYAKEQITIQKNLYIEFPIFYFGTTTNRKTSSSNPLVISSGVSFSNSSSYLNRYYVRISSNLYRQFEFVPVSVGSRRLTIYTDNDLGGTLDIHVAPNPYNNAIAQLDITHNSGRLSWSSPHLAVDQIECISINVPQGLSPTPPTAYTRDLEIIPSSYYANNYIRGWNVYPVGFSYDIHLRTLSTTYLALEMTGDYEFGAIETVNPFQVNYNDYGVNPKYNLICNEFYTVGTPPSPSYNKTQKWFENVNLKFKNSGVVFQEDHNVTAQEDAVFFHWGKGASMEVKGGQTVYLHYQFPNRQTFGEDIYSTGLADLWPDLIFPEAQSAGTARIKRNPHWDPALYPTMSTDDGDVCVRSLTIKKPDTAYTIAFDSTPISGANTTLRVLGNIDIVDEGGAATVTMSADLNKIIWNPNTTYTDYYFPDQSHIQTLINADAAVYGGVKNHTLAIKTTSVRDYDLSINPSCGIPASDVGAAKTYDAFAGWEIGRNTFSFRNTSNPLDISDGSLTQNKVINTHTFKVVNEGGDVDNGDEPNNKPFQIDLREVTIQLEPTTVASGGPHFYFEVADIADGVIADISDYSSITIVDRIDNETTIYAGQNHAESSVGPDVARTSRLYITNEGTDIQLGMVSLTVAPIDWNTPSSGKTLSVNTTSALAYSCLFFEGVYADASNWCYVDGSGYFSTGQLPVYQTDSGVNFTNARLSNCIRFTSGNLKPNTRPVWALESDGNVDVTNNENIVFNYPKSKVKVDD